MVPTMLFSGFAELCCEQIEIDPDRHQIDVVLRSTQVTAVCPLCQVIAHRRHSHYTRTLADLPISDVPVRLFLHVQKFFCDHPSCPRRIFTERLPAVVARSARRTQRLLTLQTQLGLALGGIPTARLSQPLKLPASKDTFLRLIRRAPLGAYPTPGILGVDDWALRKGHRYGSVLVDLERQTIIDLLPDRTSETFAAWLQAHPGIEVISRDRASAYAEGARQGAPQALQVADRFHMLQNLAEALRDVFRAHDQIIRAALRAPDGADAAPLILDTPPPTPRMLIAREQRRQARLAQYEQMRSCRERGMTIEAIAAHTGLSPRTILRWSKAPSFPERQGRAKQASQLDPYKAYLLKRWNEGCHNGSLLYREIKAQGYGGKPGTVLSYFVQVRKAQGIAQKQRRAGGSHSTTAPLPRPPSAQQLVWLIIRPLSRLSVEEQQQREALPAVHDDLAQAIELTHDFTITVRERKAAALDEWIMAAERSGLAPMQQFATGLKRDIDAVRAGLSLEWSTGPVEGHINRLKTVKRQMFGRAKLDLLKQRLLAA